MRLSGSLFFLLISFGALLPAQVAEVSVSLRRSQISGNDLGSFGFAELPVRLDSGFGVAARLDLYSGRFLAHELGYGFDRDQLALAGEDQGSVTVHQFFYDLMLHLTPRGAVVRPFVVGGLGFSGFFPSGSNLVQTAGITKFGFNYGGGLKFKLNRLLGLRVDVRDHVSNKPNILSLPGVTGKLHQVEFSAGVSVLF
jgi:Outer membrane protein beta-barrel domain